MGIKIDMPGLNNFIPEIPDGQIILIEGKLDPIKTFFVMHLGEIACKNGKDVVFITSKNKYEIRESLKTKDFGDGFKVIDERSSRHWKDYISNNSVLIIDSFSYLMLDKTLYEFRDVMEDMRDECKKRGAIGLFTLVDDMLGEKEEITTEYLADGIIRFLTKKSSTGIDRYIRIPRWVGNVSFDENINYTFDGTRMSVDQRERVV